MGPRRGDTPLTPAAIGAKWKAIAEASAWKDYAGEA